MNFPKDSFLVTMNPFIVGIGLLLIVCISAFSAWKYRNTNDFKKSIKMSFFLAICVVIFFKILGLPWTVLIGYLFCNFIFTSWFSNYYFYH